MLTVADKLAYLVAKLPKTGTNNQITRDTLKAMASGKLTTTAKKAISRVYNDFRSQGGSANVGQIMRLASYAAVLGAGALGAAAINKAGKKLNQDVTGYGNQTIKQQDQLLNAVKGQRK